MATITDIRDVRERCAPTDVSARYRQFKAMREAMKLAKQPA